MQQQVQTQQLDRDIANAQQQLAQMSLAQQHSVATYQMKENNNARLWGREYEDELIAREDDEDLFAREDEDDLFAREDDEDLFAREDDEDLFAREDDDFFYAREVPKQAEEKGIIDKSERNTNTASSKMSPPSFVFFCFQFLLL
jgi:hypothetical protein